MDQFDLPAARTGLKSGTARQAAASGTPGSGRSGWDPRAAADAPDGRLLHVGESGPTSPAAEGPLAAAARATRMVKDPGLAAATSLMLGADARRSWPPRLAHADASRRLAPRSAARRGISPAARLRPVPEEQARLLIHPGTRQPVESSSSMGLHTDGPKAGVYRHAALGCAIQSEPLATGCIPSASHHITASDSVTLVQPVRFSPSPGPEWLRQNGLLTPHPPNIPLALPPSLPPSPHWRSSRWPRCGAPQRSGVCWAGGRLICGAGGLVCWAGWGSGSASAPLPAKILCCRRCTQLVARRAGCGSSLSRTLSFPLSVSVSLSLCLCLSVSLCLSRFSLSLSLSSLSLLSLSLSVPLSLPPPLFLNHSFSLPLPLSFFPLSPSF